MKLKIGHLYKGLVESVFWTGEGFKLKDAFEGDIFLYIGKAKKIIHLDGHSLAPRLVYIFLDKNGEKVWLERYELDELGELEETDESI